MSCITKIVLTRSSYAVKRGEWVWNPLSAVLPSSAACNTIIWSSSNTCVVAINRSSGAFHGLSAGEATITARAADGSGVTARATVSVRDKIYVSSVTLNRSSLSLNVGKSATLTASVKPTNADNKNLKWTSGNPCVAKVSSDGKVTAVSTGRAQITAETTDCSGCSADCFVTVTENKLVTDLQIRPSSAYTVVDSSAVLTPYITPSDATNKGLKWWSENTKIATVSGGNVIGISPGDVKIYAETTDGTAIRSYATVHVRQRVPVESVKIVDTPDIVRIGSCDGWAYACVKPTNATNQRVFWSSDREEIIDITYNTGHLDARLPGKATITAMTYDGKFTDSKTLRSVYDKVIIEEDVILDTVCRKVTFTASGKVWYCVEVDLVYEPYDNRKSFYYTLSLLNFYTKYDLTTFDHINSDLTPKKYTLEELRFLYAIDPCGVAAYVKNYALTLDSIENAVEYKDTVFKTLFGRAPLYYVRRADGNFYETRDDVDLTRMLSESESIFGLHVVKDEYLLDVVDDILKFATGIFQTGTGIPVQDIYVTCTTLARAAMKANSGDLGFSFEAIVNQLKSQIQQDFQELIENSLDGEIPIGMCKEVLQFFGNIVKLREYIPSKVVVCSETAKYAYDSAAYDVYFRKNGEMMSVKDIYKIINNID